LKLNGLERAQAQGGARLHPCECFFGFAVVRVDLSHPAEARLDLVRRKPGERRAGFRLDVRRLVGDEFYRRAGVGRALGSLWPPTRHPDLGFRLLARPPGHGGGADGGLAVCRPRRVGTDGRELFRRGGLSRRRHAAASTHPSLCRVLSRLGNRHDPWPGGGRSPRRDQSARAILCGGGIRRPRLALWPAHSAGVACTGIADQDPMEKRHSHSFVRHHQSGQETDRSGQRGIPDPTGSDVSQYDLRSTPDFAITGRRRMSACC